MLHGRRFAPARSCRGIKRQACADTSRGGDGDRRCGGVQPSLDDFTPTYSYSAGLFCELCRALILEGRFIADCAKLQEVFRTWRRGCLLLGMLTITSTGFAVRHAIRSRRHYWTVGSVSARNSTDTWVVRETQDAVGHPHQRADEALSSQDGGHQGGRASPAAAPEAETENEESSRSGSLHRS